MKHHWGQTVKSQNPVGLNFFVKNTKESQVEQHLWFGNNPSIFLHGGNCWFQPANGLILRPTESLMHDGPCITGRMFCRGSRLTMGPTRGRNIGNNTALQGQGVQSPDVFFTLTVSTRPILPPKSDAAMRRAREMDGLSVAKTPKAKRV
ncbi:hypothetical protein EYF80_029273 [Liparis tanakae]|uniref:Uncharacterized protein n=1 Tax=Liparis tanakae TaxID=230148 RepID=A0A4Z2H4Z4_9TELE|nr:hypothetical protein EYF80_029273 [Liparis tanakae]